MDAKQVLQQELELSRRELRGIETEIARLTDARFDKLLSIAKTQQELDRILYNIHEPSAALRAFEAQRESDAVNGWSY